ncbi:MAG: protein-methionine-sulfoxide reductase catalytic subunit MsrP [Betaproteobacteria bacterium]
MALRFSDPTVLPSDITPETVFNNRRRFMSASFASSSLILLPNARADQVADNSKVSLDFKESEFSTDEELTSKHDATTYNNFYEFGTDKEDPVKHAHLMKTQGWQLSVEGEVHKPKTFDLDALLQLAPLEERVYRLRCVEAWSMVIPWLGFPLSTLLKVVEPTGNAKFVEFLSLHDPEQMPGQNYNVLDWPYIEGLRIDEAMNPLTLLTLGMYGHRLPNQNGAPVRLVAPWKYGFKSAKSIVKIKLVEKQPVSSWNKASPNEYGFYSNVNPAVSHPRWSQRKERRIGEFFKRDTMMFNGYGEWVSELYRDMDLTKYF